MPTCSPSKVFYRLHHRTYRCQSLSSYSRPCAVTETARAQDAQLGLIKEWLVDLHMRPSTLNHKQFENFAWRAKQFYLDIDNKLFRQSPDGRLKAVIEKTHQMYIMWSLHDYLGYKGTFATKELINKRFWWPELECDVHWYVKTCHVCQQRQKTLLPESRLL